MQSPNNYKTAREWALVKLTFLSDQSKNDVDYLLMTLANIDKQQLIDKIHQEEIIPEDILAKFIIAINKRENGEPLSYILKSCKFYYYQLFLNNYCFIPRQETITLVNAVFKKFTTDDNLQVLELGTGCGNIAVCLAKQYKNWSLSITDICEQSMLAAQQNIDFFNITNVSNFIVTDWLNNINNYYDLIISNPPYAKQTTINPYSFEPATTMNGGVTGIEPTLKIIKNAAKHLNSKGYLILETTQEHIATLLPQLASFNFKHTETIKDHNALERVMICQKIN